MPKASRSSSKDTPSKETPSKANEEPSKDDEDEAETETPAKGKPAKATEEPEPRSLAQLPRAVGRRVVAGFDAIADSRRSRIAIAVALTLMHLLLFWAAGQDRLGLPFNSAPDDRPYYSDPMAYSTVGKTGNRQPHHWSRLIVSRWDSQHYIGFAVRGLSACPEHPNDDTPRDTMYTDARYLQCGLGWQPALGILGGTVSKITGVAEDWSIVWIAILSTILANFLWTAAPFVKRLGNREALGALIAFNAFPSAFHLVAPYTESITMMLALAGFVALADNKWILSGLFVGAATAFRTAAVAYSAAFGLAALFAAYKRRKAGDKKWWKPLTGIPLCGWSMALQMLLLKIYVGDALAYVRARHMYGDNHDYFRVFSFDFILKGITAQHMDGFVMCGCIAIVSLCVREVVRKIGAAESVFLIVASILGLMLGGAGLIARGDASGGYAGTWGMNRYMLMLPITFVCAGVLLRKAPVTYLLWIAICMAIYWHVELCSFISQGDMNVCPCLGRYQFSIPFQS